jgi:hypothetical protein
MHELTPELQFALFFNLLLTVPGMFAILGFILAAIAVIALKPTRWWLLALLLFFSPLIPAVSELLSGRTITPFHQMQVYGRPICGALLVLLLIPIFSDRGWRMKLISGSAIAYLVFELIFSARFAVGGTALRGIFGAVLFMLIFAVFAIGLPRWLQDMFSIRAMLRSIAVAGLLMVVGTLIQLTVNRGAIIAQDRLYCLTGNPQQAGLVLGMTLLPTAFLAAWKGELKFLRLVWAVLSAIMVLLLVWTGSRTGVLVAAIGLVLLFRRHVGRMLLFSMVCGTLVMLGAQMWFDISDPAGRLLSGVDSRTHVWLQLIRDFMSNPVFGVGEAQGLASESSYLSVAARVGMVGLVPLAIALTIIVTDLIRLHRVRHLLREQSMLVDLVIGGMVAVLFGALLEGYLIGVIAHQVFILYIYLATITFLLDAAAFNAALWQSEQTRAAFRFDQQSLAPAAEALSGE